MSKKTEGTFEERLKRLEEISQNLRGPSLDLSQAFSQFEEGITLARTLEKELAEMDRRMEILVNNAQVQADPETPAEFREGDLFS